MAGEYEQFAITDAEVIGTVTDDMGDEVRLGVLGGAVLVGVTGSPAILATPAQREQFMRFYMEAERRAEAYEPSAVPPTGPHPGDEEMS